jgi:hypothetical protein
MRPVESILGMVGRGMENDEGVNSFNYAML